MNQINYQYVLTLVQGEWPEDEEFKLDEASSGELCADIPVLFKEYYVGMLNPFTMRS